MGGLQIRCPQGPMCIFPPLTSGIDQLSTWLYPAPPWKADLHGLHHGSAPLLSLSWSWEPGRWHLAGDARREKGEFRFLTYLALFQGTCHGLGQPSIKLMAPIRQPSPHNSCGHALSGFLGLGTGLPLVLSSHLLTAL